MRRFEGLVGKICGVVGVGPEWDCGRCRLDGLNGLFLYCRVSMISMYLIYYCHMYWDTVKSIVSCALYRQSIPFIEKERRECRM